MSIAQLFTPSSLRRYLALPYERIIASWTLEEVFVRFAWLAIPLEFFILTRFPGGLHNRHGVAIVLVALLALLVVLALSLALAAAGSLFRRARNRTSYRTGVRIWSVSLVLNWSTALGLLALGYVGASSTGKEGHDLIAQVLVNRLRKIFPDYGDYPHLLDPTTFTVYYIYALTAAVLLAVVAWACGRAPAEQLKIGPNLFWLACLSAFIMMVTHGITRLA
jgi:hypothetical protein